MCSFTYTHVGVCSGRNIFGTDKRKGARPQQTRHSDSACKYLWYPAKLCNLSYIQGHAADVYASFIDFLFRRSESERERTDMTQGRVNDMEFVQGHDNIAQPATSHPPPAAAAPGK